MKLKLDLSYSSKIYLFHIIIVAIPLLYIGIKGLSGETLPKFYYILIQLVGGMALFYHGYYLFNNLRGKVHNH